MSRTKLQSYFPRVLAAALTIFYTHSAFAQARTHIPQKPAITFKVLHSFTGLRDGCCILGGLARDGWGNLYGIAYLNNSLSGDGDLFKLTPTSRGYKFSVVLNFSASKGRECQSTPAVDGSGNVFGVCVGGGGIDRGTLWEYSNTGKFRVLHEFGGPPDGMSPQDSVVLDHGGNIYGTAYTWGPGSSGTFWKYSLRSGLFKLLHGFTDGDDGGLLPAGPRLDEIGGLVWGTTEVGPNCYYCGQGTVWNYDLSSEKFTTVLDFSSSNILAPQSRLSIGMKGNVIGTAFGTEGGRNNCGLVYELQKDNSYMPAVLYQFTGQTGDGCYPFGRVRWDRQGHLLGTTYGGGTNGDGVVYELVQKNSRWQETILHSFDLTDGTRPQAGLVTDHKGNWFGTTASGGKYKNGTVFEISGVQ